MKESVKQIQIVYLTLDLIAFLALCMLTNLDDSDSPYNSILHYLATHARHFFILYRLND